MITGPRRGVTRGYVWGLIAASLIGALALVVACWGFLAVLLAREPVESAAPQWLAPVCIGVSLGFLGIAMWQQSLALLRGRKAPSIALAVAAACGSYILWAVLGTLLGWTTSETWASPFALSLIPIWIIAALGCWAVLLRRVYTDLPTPRWPWERPQDDS